MPDLMHHVTEIARCAALFRQEELTPLGLKSCHSSYIDAICTCPGITQDQLARRIFINKSNVARQLVILEEEGYVERRPSPEDKRAIQVFPTQKAIEAMQKVADGQAPKIIIPSEMQGLVGLANGIVEGAGK